MPLHQFNSKSSPQFSISSSQVIQLGIVVVGVAIGAVFIFDQISNSRGTSPQTGQHAATVAIFTGKSDTQRRATFSEIEPPPNVSWPLSAQESSSADEWRNWRGGDFTNSKADWEGPLQWNDETGILWRTQIQGHGNSTPIAVREHIYLTAADAEGKLWLLLCDLRTGVKQHRTLIFEGAFPARHEKTSDAASTPASDGQRIFVAWADRSAAFLGAFDLRGQHLWTRELGPFTAGWGFASSPACADGLVIVSADNAQNGFLTAVRADSGENYWRHARPRGSEGSYSSPVIVRAGSSRHAIISGLNKVQAFDLRTGKMIWECEGPSTVSASTPAIAENYCVASSGYPNSTLMAISIDMKGSKASVVWKVTKSSEVPYVPSPVIAQGKVFIVQDDGLAFCRELSDGNIIWKRRLGGTFSASPVLLGHRLVCVDESGRCLFLDIQTGSIIEENTFPHGCFATPVPIQNQLLIRTTEELLLIGR